MSGGFLKMATAPAVSTRTAPGGEMIQAMDRIIGGQYGENSPAFVNAWSQVYQAHGAKPPQIGKNETNPWTGQVSVSGVGGLAHELGHVDQFKNAGMGGFLSNLFNGFIEEALYKDQRYNIPGTVDFDAQTRARGILGEMKGKFQSFSNEWGLP